MNHSRCGRSKNPGTVSRHAAVVTSLRRVVVERWISQPSRKNQAMPWVRKRRLYQSPICAHSNRNASAPSSRTNGKRYGWARSCRRTAGTATTAVVSRTSWAKTSMNQKCQWSSRCPGGPT